MSSVVVKRGGKDEKFDERKLYASIYASLIAVTVSTKESELIASEITKIVKRWLSEKSHITSHEIRHYAARALEDYNHTAAYLYSKHRVLS